MITRGSTNVFALHQTLCIAISSLVALVMWHYWDNPESYWLVLTALFLLQIPVRNSGLRQSIFILFCGIGLMINVSLVQYAAVSHASLTLYLFFTTLIFGYAGIHSPRFFLVFFLINIAGLLSAGLLTTHELSRIQSILAGTGLALIARLLLWPVSIKQQLRASQRDFLHASNVMQRKIFSIYLARDYEKKHYYYERELHSLRKPLLTILQDMRQLRQKTLGQTEETCSRLFDLLTAIGSLRYRIKDASTLELCENELKGISHALSHSFSHLSSDTLNELLTQINAMEAVYYRVLQTAAKEAEVFLIFLKQLYSMQDELEAMMREKTDVK